MTEISAIGNQITRGFAQTFADGPWNIVKGVGESLWGVATFNGETIKDGVKDVATGVVDIPSGIANATIQKHKDGEVYGIFEQSPADKPMSEESQTNKTDPLVADVEPWIEQPWL